MRVPLCVCVCACVRACVCACVRVSVLCIVPKDKILRFKSTFIIIITIIIQTPNSVSLCRQRQRGDTCHRGQRGRGPRQRHGPPDQHPQRHGGPQ